MAPGTTQRRFSASGAAKNAVAAAYASRTSASDTPWVRQRKKADGRQRGADVRPGGGLGQRDDGHVAHRTITKPSRV